MPGVKISSFVLLRGFVLFLDFLFERVAHRAGERWGSVKKWRTDPHGKRAPIYTARVTTVRANNSRNDSENIPAYPTCGRGSTLQHFGSGTRASQRSRSHAESSETCRTSNHFSSHFKPPLAKGTSVGEPGSHRICPQEQETAAEVWRVSAYRFR